MSPGVTENLEVQVMNCAVGGQQARVLRIVCISPGIYHLYMVYIIYIRMLLNHCCLPEAAS